MKKTELYTYHLDKEYATNRVWDRWFDWRCKEAGITDRRNDDRWYDILDGMPEQFDWSPSTRDGMMHFTWVDGSEEIPLVEFYDDEKDQPDLEMWWHSNYYDGPLSGMAKYNGEWVWFDCIEENDYNGDRIFALYELTEEQVEGEKAHYFAFRTEVSTWCDHHPDVMKLPGDEQVKKDFMEFFNNHDKWPDLKLTSGKKLGEFHWYQFKYWSKPC